MDGTLLSSNVIETYLWLRLRELSGTERFAELGRIAARVPSLVRAERRERSAFLRSVYREYDGARLADLDAIADAAPHRPRAGPALAGRGPPDPRAPRRRPPHGADHRRDPAADPAAAAALRPHRGRRARRRRPRASAPATSRRRRWSGSRGRPGCAQYAAEQRHRPGRVVRLRRLPLRPAAARGGRATRSRSGPTCRSSVTRGGTAGRSSTGPARTSQRADPQPGRWSRMMLALEMFRSVPRTVAGKAIGGRMPGVLSGFAAPLRLVTIDEPQVDRPGWARLQHPALRHLRLRPRRAVGPDQPLLLGRRVAAVRARPRGGRRAARGLRGPARGHPRGRRPGAHLRRPRRRAVRRLRGRRDQPVLADHRRAPRARPADRLLQGHRRRLGPAARRAPQPAARRARGLLRRAGDPHRAGRLRGAHRAARRRPRQRPGAGERRRLGRAVRHARAARADRRRRDHRGRQARATSASWPASSARPRWSPPGEVLRRVRRSTGAFQLEPEFSSPYLLGGVDVAVDAVGSKQSLETALHATRAGGRVVLSGMPRAGRPLGRLVPRARGGRHLRVGPVRRARSPRSRPSLVATDAVQQIAKSVATYPLHRWREALDHAHSAGRLGTVKVAFDPRSTSMSRPGFVLEVDDRTPPLVVHEGQGFRLESFPLGTRVVYPPESLPAVPDVDAGDPRRAAAPARLGPAAGAAVRGHEADDRLRRPLAAAADDAPAGHPRPDHRARADDGRRGRRRRRRADRRQRAAPADDRRRAQAHRGGAGLPLVLPAGRALQLRRRGPRQPRPPRHHREGRGHRDQQAGRRVRPAGLRQRQPRGDGRRPQVGRHRAGVVQVACATTTTPRRWCSRARSWTTSTPRCTTPPGGWAGSSRTPSRSSRSRPRSTTTSSRSPTTSCRSASGSGRSRTRPRCSACAAGWRSRRSGCGTRCSTTCGRSTA